MNQQNTIWTVLGLVAVVVVLFLATGVYYPTTQPRAAYSTDPLTEAINYSKKMDSLGEKLDQFLKTVCPVAYLAEPTDEPQDIISWFKKTCALVKPATEPTTARDSNVVCAQIAYLCGDPKFKKMEDAGCPCITR